MEISNKVFNSGLYNFQGLKIKLPIFWNIQVLEKLLHNYKDKEIIQFLKYGWPISHDSRRYNTEKIKNWKGALINKTAVKAYLENELKYKSVVGPFKSNPFNQPIGILPLNMRDKKDSMEKRIILDLSFPEGLAVSEGIDKTTYQGVNVDWRLPTVDTLPQLMIKKGVGSLLFKHDLKRYYRQIFVDPSDAVKLGYYVNDVIYIDSTLPMGMTSSCYIVQRVSSIIPFIMQQRGYSAVNYIDDLGGVDSASKAELAFEELGNILAEIGILESVQKATPPSTKMVFLGILLDSINQTLSIDSERLQNIKATVSIWLNKSKALLNELQKLIGLLSFAATCVREGQLFFSSILTVLKEAYLAGKQVEITCEMKKDLHWWDKFLIDYNGASCIPTDVWSRPDEIFSTDSCLSGCGACLSSHFMHFEIPDFIIKEGKRINQFELYAILIATREWAPLFANLNILLYCDNQTSVQVL